MFKKVLKWSVKRKEERKNALRKKNWKLRQEGKDPHKGWNPMINTGLGGLNKVSRGERGEIDNRAYFLEEQKHARKDKE
ncbi:hypothetical protein D920_02511 [Enterococcus faecalis 13-SD-W-01]|nr:hypothetical protein D920_02511 [Enterococcus faecalis 13-SD-W-01]